MTNYSRPHLANPFVHRRWERRRTTIRLRYWRWARTARSLEDVQPVDWRTNCPAELAIHRSSGAASTLTTILAQRERRESAKTFSATVAPFRLSNSCARGSAQKRPASK